MGVLLDNLAKRGEAVNISGQAVAADRARETVAKANGIKKDIYPTGNDTFTPVDALGSASGDLSNQDEEPGVDTINLDATLFDQKVRELVQSAAGQGAYGYKAAKAAGLIKTVNHDLVAAVQRVQKNAGFLNRLVALTNARKAKKRTMQTQPSASGSQSGSASGSISGQSSDDVAGSDTVMDVQRAARGDSRAALRLMGRR